MKRILAFLLITAYMAVLLTALTFADGVKFTKSPKSVTLDNFQEYPISWEIDCKFKEGDYYVIQQRENETWDWGNTEVVRKPEAVIPGVYANTSFQYRIMYCSESQEYFSDAFTVTWTKPDDITTVEMSMPDVGTILRGSATEPVPLTIKNTGKYDLRIASVENGGSGSAIDIIENKKLTVLKAGETDSTSYSVKIRSEFSPGTYGETVALYAHNLDDVALFTVSFDIVDSDQATFILTAETPVVTCMTGSSVPSDLVPIIVKNTGTATLTNVRLVREDEQRNVFNIYSRSINYLAPGNDSGETFLVQLLGGNDPGEYETTVRIYADGIEEPVVVTLKGTYVPDGEWERIKEEESKNQVQNKGDGSMPAWAIVLIVIASVIVLGGAAAAVILIMRSKNKKG